MERREHEESEKLYQEYLSANAIKCDLCEDKLEPPFERYRHLYRDPRIHRSKRLTCHAACFEKQMNADGYEVVIDSPWPIGMFWKPITGCMATLIV